jgi:hypothetical protein
MRRFMAGLALAVQLAGCATTPETVTSQTTAEMRATVEIIDPVTRQVLLRGQDGRIVSITAGPEVRNFDRLSPGDKVRAVFVESIAARMAEPGEAAVTRAGVATERAPVGGTPGGATGVAIQSVVSWVSYDPRTFVSTFVGPSGLTHSVVTPEEMRRFAASRRPGDRVHIDFTTAFAIGIETVAG